MVIITMKERYFLVFSALVAGWTFSNCTVDKCSDQVTLLPTELTIEDEHWDSVLYQVEQVYDYQTTADTVVFWSWQKLKFSIHSDNSKGCDQYEEINHLELKSSDYDHVLEYVINPLDETRVLVDFEFWSDRVILKSEGRTFNFKNAGQSKVFEINDSSWFRFSIDSGVVSASNGVTTINRIQ